MAYEDTIRVAELKIRPERFARVREEVKLGDDQLLEIAEFLHPRVQEIADTLPDALGPLASRDAAGRAARSARLTAQGPGRPHHLDRAASSCSTLSPSLKPLRPRSLRNRTEQRALDDWLGAVRAAAERDYRLGVEVAACRGLVKGYGETIERGRERFAAIIDDPAGDRRQT